LNSDRSWACRPGREVNGFNLKNETPLAAAIFNVAGVHADGWCAPSIRFDAGFNAPVSIMELRFWLRPEASRKESRVTVRCSGGAPAEFDLAHDRSIRVQAACVAATGDVVRVNVDCDNAVSGAGRDQRVLSFKLQGVSFT
jgi:hypothetical protein